MRFSFFKILIPVLVLMAAGCSKDEDAKQGFMLSFDINKAVVNYRSGGDLQFNEGFITIREVVFDGDLVNGLSHSITHSKVVVFDFATGAGTPDDEVIELPAGEYKNVYLGIELQDVNDDPTLVLKGTYEKDNGIVYPIRFEFNSGEVFEAEAASAVIAPGTTAIAKITFDPHAWFANVTFEMLENSTVNANGVIVISETQNANIFDIVANGLDLATEAVFQ